MFTHDYEILKINKNKSVLRTRSERFLGWSRDRWRHSNPDPTLTPFITYAFLRGIYRGGGGGGLGSGSFQGREKVVQIYRENHFQSFYILEIELGNILSAACNQAAFQVSFIEIEKGGYGLISVFRIRVLLYRSGLDFFPESGSESAKNQAPIRKNPDP